MKLIAAVTLLTPMIFSLNATATEGGDFLNNLLLKSKFLEAKRQSREEMIYGPSNGMKSADRFTNYYIHDFFGEGASFVRDINYISDEKLHKGQIKKDIWTGSFWPLKNGGIAYRYRGRGGNSGSFDWNYRRRTWPLSIHNMGNINALSPAEKYDLLIGDSNFSLTNFEWQRGKIRASNSRIQSWEGHCNGWSIASVKEKRPLKAVTVKSAQGMDITFYPADIKALSTALWSNLMTYKQRVEGVDVIQMAGRDCRSKRPARDWRSGGRATELHCIDTNPGIWHIIMVNTLGMKGQTVTFDVSSDTETWNHPIMDYSYEFFNPNRRFNTSTDVKDVMIPIEQLRRDRYAKYRATKTRYIVGVKMNITYFKMKPPERSATDKPFSSRTARQTYQYDLEIDENFKIIGGEWHQRKMPDFVWRTAPELDGTSPADNGLDQFNLKSGHFPSGWLSNAKKSSSYGMPASKIVRKLIEMSQ